LVELTRFTIADPFPVCAITLSSRNTISQVKLSSQVPGPPLFAFSQPQAPCQQAAVPDQVFCGHARTPVCGAGGRGRTRSLPTPRLSRPPVCRRGTPLALANPSCYIRGWLATCTRPRPKVSSFSGGHGPPSSTCCGESSHVFASGSHATGQGSFG
jgi:hypothetical protein